MRKKRIIIGFVALSLLTFLSVQKQARSGQEPPTLEEQIEQSVVIGLNWLANQQNANGSWGSYDFVGHTGLAVLKFEDRAIDLGYSPLDADYEYHSVVQAGLDFLVSQANSVAISTQPAGNPDGNGNGMGVWFGTDYFHSVYSTGIAMMAIAASGAPPTYQNLLQDALDWMAWAQVDETCGIHRGGWRYQPDCDSDNSNAGYATLGLGFAAAQPPFGFGLIVPQFVKDELDIWIGNMQDPVDGDNDDGGSYYTPYWGWVNILKTGNLLYEMALVGDDADTQRVKDAIDYIERTWFDPSQDPGWRNHRQAMFTMMKGFEALGIEYIDLDSDGIAEHDWFEEVALHLIATQNLDGSWPYDYWGDQILSTAWALLTLEKAVPKFEISVSVDIKPGSCPNALGRMDKGVLPLAICGTEDFDVLQIDPTSIFLTREGNEAKVFPLRWSYEDAATPFTADEPCGCHILAADGFGDLSLKFNMSEVISALELDSLSVNDILPILLKGKLKEEHGGTPIGGQDCVRIVR